MKSFGKILLWVGLFVFFIAGYALGNTYYVTQNGGGGAMSAGEFNALTGDHSGDTFFFSGNFTTRITVQIHGSSSGHVTLDGSENGSCNPTTALDHSLCSVGGVQAANLRFGMRVGTRSLGRDYVIIQDFNMDGDNSGGTGDYMVEFLGGTGGHNVFRRNTVVNTPMGFMDNYAKEGIHSPNLIIEDNKFYGFHKTGWTETSFRTQRIKNAIYRRNIIGGDGVHSGFPPANSGELCTFHESEQILLEYNQIFRSHGQSLIRPKESGHQENIIVRYNNLWGGTWQGISSYGNTQHNHYFYGNRVANSLETGVNALSGGN